MTHMMIDIETLGTRPGAAILEIGAVCFDWPSGRLVDRMGIEVDQSSCDWFGLHREPETVAWWDAKGGWPDTGRKKMPLEVALGMLEKQVKFRNPEVIWCWGATFDFPLLEEAFRRVGIEVPWKYWQCRCARTLYTTLGGGKRRPAAHFAVEDCLRQISDLVGALKEKGLAA